MRFIDRLINIYIYDVMRDRWINFFNIQVDIEVMTIESHYIGLYLSHFFKDLNVRKFTVLEIL